MDDRFATSLAEDQHRRCAAALFNGVWALMEQETRTTEEDEVMVEAPAAPLATKSAASANRGVEEFSPELLRM